LQDTTGIDRAAFAPVLSALAAPMVQAQVAPLMQQMQQMAQTIQALTPLAQQQEYAALDKNDMDKISEFLPSVPGATEAGVAPQDVFATMRAIQQAWIENGIPREVAHSRERAHQAKDQALAIEMGKRVASMGQPRQPAFASPQPHVPAVPVRGGAGTSPAPSAYSRDNAGRFASYDANQIALSAFSK
jgi:hypothetical protein